jgi:hypothetical protein
MGWAHDEIEPLSPPFRLHSDCATWSPLRAAEPELAFAVVGDWGKGNTKQKAVAEVLGKAAESIGARFIVSAGDNFYPRGVTSVSDPNWKTLFENVYTAPSLMVPWHAVLGNHDHRGSTAAQIAYSKTSTRWRLPLRSTSTAKGLPTLSTPTSFFSTRRRSTRHLAGPGDSGRSKTSNMPGSSASLRRAQPTGKSSSATTRSIPAAVMAIRQS